MSGQCRDMKKYERDYNQQPFEAYQVMFRRENIINRLKKRPHDKVLEIGCGNEPLFKYVNDVEKWVVIEPASGFYNHAMELARDGTKNVILINNYLEKSLREIKELKIEFDYIICSSLLHELDEPDELLRAIYNLCSANTVAHINVPNARSFHRLLAVCMGLIEDVHYQSERSKLLQQSDMVYNIETLKETCMHAGFKVIDSGSYFVKVFTHKQMQECMDSHIIDMNLLYGLNRLIDYMPEYGSEIFVELKK